MIMIIIATSFKTQKWVNSVPATLWVLAAITHLKIPAANPAMNILTWEQAQALTLSQFLGKIWGFALRVQPPPASPSLLWAAESQPHLPWLLLCLSQHFRAPARILKYWIVKGWKVQGLCMRIGTCSAQLPLSSPCPSASSHLCFCHGPLQSKGTLGWFTSKMLFYIKNAPFLHQKCYFFVH